MDFTANKKMAAKTNRIAATYFRDERFFGMIATPPQSYYDRPVRSRPGATE